jgi:acid phosphatase family membrane protein YuiD
LDLTEGFNTSTFAVALVITIIVTYDAANVRWQSGLHAQRINQLIRDVFNRQQINE